MTVAALLGVVVGGLVGLLGGLTLQWRTDRRRMRGAALMIAAELWTNGGEVEHYFVSEQLESEGSTSVLSMPINVSVEAWRAHGSEVVHLAGPELAQTLFRLYTYLDRFESERRLLRPSGGQHMREAAAELQALARRTWRDRVLLV